MGPIIARRHRRYAMGNARPVIEALHLPPDEAARLKELLTTKWLAGADAADVLQRMDNVPRSVREKAVDSAEAEQEQKIQEFLGKDQYAAFKAATDGRLAGTGNWILFTDFWDAGVPLNAEQKSALAHTLAQTKAVNRGTADATDEATGLKKSDTDALEAAAAFLSPEQLSYLRRIMLDEARYQQAVRNNARRKAAAKSGA